MNTSRVFYSCYDIVFNRYSCLVSNSINYYYSKCSLKYGQSFISVATDIPNLKIFGGKVVDVSSRKSLCNHSASIMPYYRPFWVCSAFIINHRQVATAAHCVYDIPKESIYVRSGNILSYSGGTVKTISKIRIHPSFNSTRNDSDSDIAIIDVNTPWEYDSTIGPIRLANPSDDYIYQKIGTNVSVCGFGDSEIGPFVLHFIELPLNDLNKCKYDFAPEDVVTDNMTCIGNISIYQYLAVGDSGGIR